MKEYLNNHLSYLVDQEHITLDDANKLFDIVWEEAKMRNVYKYEKFTKVDQTGATPRQALDDLLNLAEYIEFNWFVKAGLHAIKYKID